MSGGQGVASSNLASPTKVASRDRWILMAGNPGLCRLEALAVFVLTALSQRDAAVPDAERRAGEALQTMTIDEGLSLREPVE